MLPYFERKATSSGIVNNIDFVVERPPQVTARSDIVEDVDLVVEGPSQLTERSDTVEDVLSRVRSFSNQRSPVKDAVRYCLSEIHPEAPTDDEMKKLLAKFYLNVVEPYGNPFFLLFFFFSKLCNPKC